MNEFVYFVIRLEIKTFAVAPFQKKPSLINYLAQSIFNADLNVSLYKFKEIFTPLTQNSAKICLMKADVNVV